MNQTTIDILNAIVRGNPISLASIVDLCRLSVRQEFEIERLKKVNSELGETISILSHQRAFDNERFVLEARP